MTQVQTPYPAEPDRRSRIIASVTSPIGLLALIVLVIEGVLAIVCVQLPNPQKFYVALAMVGLIAIVLVIVARDVWKRGLEVRRVPSNGPAFVAPITQEVFVSAVMAAYSTDEEYQVSRAGTLKVVEALRRKAKGTVFYAGENLSSTKNFDKAATVATTDMNLVASSKYFMLIYFQKIASSALMEAGVALMAGRPSLYCVHDRKDLPYLMQKAVEDFQTPAACMDVNGYEDLVSQIDKYGMSIFEPAEKNAPSSD